MKAMPDREPLARTMICGKRYRSAYTRRFYVCNQANGHRGACGWAGTLHEEVVQRYAAMMYDTYAADALRRYHVGLHHATGNPDSNGW